MAVAPQRKKRQARPARESVDSRCSATEIVMRNVLYCVAALVSSSAAVAQSPAQAPAPAPLVFFDIAGPEEAKLPEFYAKLFGWRVDETGNWSINVMSPLGGTLRSGDPTEKRLYIGVNDVTAKLAEVTEHGGTIDAPRFEVSGVVVLGLFKDPAGNPMALVEMQNGKVKVP
jgi:uncharacterized protein